METDRTLQRGRIENIIFFRCDIEVAYNDEWLYVALPFSNLLEKIEEMQLLADS